MRNGMRRGSLKPSGGEGSQRVEPETSGGRTGGPRSGRSRGTSPGCPGSASRPVTVEDVPEEDTSRDAAGVSLPHSPASASIPAFADDGELDAPRRANRACPPAPPPAQPGYFDPPSIPPISPPSHNPINYQPSPGAASAPQAWTPTPPQQNPWQPPGQAPVAPRLSLLAFRLPPPLPLPGKSLINPDISMWPRPSSSTCGHACDTASAYGRFELIQTPRREPALSPTRRLWLRLRNTRNGLSRHSTLRMSQPR